jgi:methionyl aminopeptidase
MVVSAPWQKERLLRGARIVVTVLSKLAEAVRPGITTWDLEIKARNMLERLGGEPAFLGYEGYPAVLCTSVNEEVVHGIPSSRKVLQEGDIISIDFGVKYKGFFADAALTVPVGEIRPEVQELLNTATLALKAGISAFRVGNTIGDVGKAIEGVAKAGRYGVVREYVGHGIGRALHEDPRVPNYGSPGEGPVIEEGLVVAIEPMLTLGSGETSVKEDGWTVVTRDGSLAVHVEHMVMATSRGPLLLTEGLPLYSLSSHA